MQKADSSELEINLTSKTIKLQIKNRANLYLAKILFIDNTVSA